MGYTYTMKIKLSRLMVMVLTIFTLMIPSGCTVQKSQIAYTVYPIGYLIRTIAGDTVNAQSIQEDGSTIQYARLKDNWQTILEDSGVFFHVGNIEPYYTLIRSTLRDMSIVNYDLSGLNAIYKNIRYTPIFDDGQLLGYSEGPFYDDPSFDHIDMTENDLNLWLNPISMLSMADDITTQLCSLYPEYETTFKSNFENLKTELVRLDAQYQALSSTLRYQNQQIRMVTLTNAFGNWQKAYGFEIYPVVLSKFGVMPTDTQLEVIKNRIIEDQVHYIVYEPNMSDEMIELFNTLSEELDLTRVDLTNCSAQTSGQNESAIDYLTMMYDNLSVLQSMAEPRGGNGDANQ